MSIPSAADGSISHATKEMSLLAEVAATVRHLRDERQTRIIAGFAGPPGSGKSTVVEAVAKILGPDACAVVSMDGFHLANSLLSGTALVERKGAIETFDVHGFLNLLERLRRNDDPVVYAPSYERRHEEPIATSVAVLRDCSIVLTDGNYLLSVDGPWAKVRGYLDVAWFIETPAAVRLHRLVRRHMAFGKSAEAARAWASGPDAANAVLIEADQGRADRILRWG